MAEHESNLAVLVDFENMARPGLKGRGDFDIHLVLNRLADKGRVLVKRAYADWSRYRDARHELQNAGLGLIEMPSAREGAKNRADIQMAVDAMELAYSRSHVDNFVIVSGDSDFTPLVGKLRELNKRVTGVGNRESASELLIANCDEFIFYDLLAGTARGRSARPGPGGKTDPVELLRDTLTALQREGVEWPLASVVKDSMRRKYPAFDESDHGFSTYSKFLEDAAKRELVRLETDPRSGTYRVEMTAGRDEVPALPPALVASVGVAVAEERGGEGAGDGRRRRRRRRSEPAGEERSGVSMPEDPVGDDPDMETFEVVVVPTPDLIATELPPLDEPISYEDMIMLGDVGDELPVELAEVSDVPAGAPPARSARRRRRRGAGEPEPTVADLAPLDVDVDAEALVLPEAALEPAAAAEPAEEPEGSRRRRRRVSAAAPEPAGEDEAPAPSAPEAASEPEAPDAEAPAPPAPEPAAVPAPTRTRGRVRRGTALPAAEVAAAPEAIAEEEAPKPKRRTRKKAVEPEGAEAAAGTDAASEEAPTPKRRTRKKAEPEAATVAEAGGEEAPKPKRRTRKKAGPEADAAAAETPAEEAPKPKRRTRKKAEPAAADGDGAQPPQAAAEAGEDAQATAGEGA